MRGLGGTTIDPAWDGISLPYSYLYTFNLGDRVMDADAQHP